jgi:type II secretory pathway pseudopilin PulG
MTCPHCGADVPSGLRFCQRCRKRVAGDPVATPALSPSGAPGTSRPPTRPTPFAFERPMAVTILAVLNLLGGTLVLLGGVAMAFMLFAAGTPSAPAENRALVAVLFAVYAIIGALQIATGVGLLKLQPWGRTLQIIGATLGLLGIPCGTIISIVILVYMLKPEVRTLFSGVSPRRLPPEEVARVEALSQGSAVAVVIGVVVVGFVAVAMIGIVAAIAIPSLLRARVAANEAATIGDLRTVVSAQAAYSSANSGFPDRLECLAAPARCIPGYPAGSPAFLDSPLLSSPRHGYRFRLVAGPQVQDEIRQRGQVSPSSLQGWAYLAVPVQAGQTGVRAFCAEMSGVICMSPSGALSETTDGSCPRDCTPLR